MSGFGELVPNVTDSELKRIFSPKNVEILVYGPAFPDGSMTREEYEKNQVLEEFHRRHLELRHSLEEISQLHWKIFMERGPNCERRLSALEQDVRQVIGMNTDGPEGEVA